MRRETHLQSLTKAPSVAQSGLAIKLTATTSIIDRLLLAQQQSAWKIYDQGDLDTGDGDGTDTGTDTGTGTEL